MAEAVSDMLSQAVSTDGPSAALLDRMSEAKARAVRAGQLAPAFRLKDIHGASVALIDLVAEGPLVLHFFRGSWCSFCETALERMSAVDEAVRALGASQVAIGPAPVDDLQLARLSALAMPVLVDPGLEATAAYGLSAILPEEDRQRYLSLGYTPATVAGRSKWLVTIPATLVLDGRGRVVLSAIDDDYRNRLEGSEILATLRAIHGRG